MAYKQIYTNQTTGDDIHSTINMTNNAPAIACDGIHPTINMINGAQVMAYKQKYPDETTFDGIHPTINSASAIACKETYPEMKTGDDIHPSVQLPIVIRPILDAFQEETGLQNEDEMPLGSVTGWNCQQTEDNISQGTQSTKTVEVKNESEFCTKYEYSDCTLDSPWNYMKSDKSISVECHDAITTNPVSMVSDVKTSLENEPLISLVSQLNHEMKSEESLPKHVQYIKPEYAENVPHALGTTSLLSQWNNVYRTVNYTWEDGVRLHSEAINTSLPQQMFRSTEDIKHVKTEGLEVAKIVPRLNAEPDSTMPKTKSVVPLCNSSKTNTPQKVRYFKLCTVTNVSNTPDNNTSSFAHAPSKWIGKLNMTCINTCILDVAGPQEQGYQA